MGYARKGWSYAMNAGSVSTLPMVPMSMPNAIPPKQAEQTNEDMPAVDFWRVGFHRLIFHSTV